MKKSEFEAKRRPYWIERGFAAEHLAGRLVNDVDAAIDAGVVWDPEEEPLPERLRISADGNFLLGRDASGSFEIARILKPASRWHSAQDEIVRRYNAWPELEKVARALETGRWPPDEAAIELLHSILRGEK